MKLYPVVNAYINPVHAAERSKAAALIPSLSCTSAAAEGVK